MNELKVFSSSEFGELGVMLINEKKYFPATQCAVILDRENPARAVRKYCKGVTKTVPPLTAAHKRSTTYPKVISTA